LIYFFVKRVILIFERNPLQNWIRGCQDWTSWPAEKEAAPLIDGFVVSTTSQLRFGVIKRGEGERPPNIGVQRGCVIDDGQWCGKATKAQPKPQRMARPEETGCQRKEE
jgi:hypothetical protein